MKLRPVSFSVAGTQLTLNAGSGTFSSEKLDKGTAILLRQFEQFPKDGVVLDLGCGWGPIGISLAKLNPGVRVWGVDINARSVELANSNSKDLGLANFQATLPTGLPADLQFDEIWSNPPIRIGKQALHELLSSYLKLLKQGGRAMLVVQKQLGAESLLRWLQEQNPSSKVSKRISEKGYWVIEVISSATNH
jgi:16S rRNA G1207 methylase RsmC